MRERHLRGCLGSYPDREEFLVERVLVWVMIPNQDLRRELIQRADQRFEEIWSALPKVQMEAQRESRTIIPKFWERHDAAGTSDEQFIVYGIWIEPDGSAQYRVAANYDFENAGRNLPELPENHSIMVSRDSKGVLSASE